MKRLLIVSVLLLSIARLSAQSQRTISLLSGYTVPNSSEWSYIAGGSVGIDGSVSMRQSWGYCDTMGYFPLLRYPYDLGIRANFTCFPNAIAGQRIGVTAFINEPVWYLKRRIVLQGDTLPVTVKEPLKLEMDAGLAFYTNPYCRTPNPQNVFIGSYTNCLIQVGLSYSRRMRDMSQVVFAAKFAHSSNGYLKKPNKGLNYLQMSLGYVFPERYSERGILESKFDTADHRGKSYQPVTNWKEYRLVDNPAFRGSDLIFSYAPGVVMPRYEARQKYFYAHTAQAGYIYRFNPARAIGATLDLTYNYSHTAVIQHWHEDYRLPFYVGVAGVYEATFHHLTLHTAVAAYLARSEHGTTPLYERVGLYYTFGPEYRRCRHFVGVALKSHMAHIDFIEWHYGIRFRTK